MRRGLLTILAALWFGGSVQAAQFYTLKVSHVGDTYQVHADVHLAAPLPQVYKVLTDYNHLTRISGAVRQSRVLKQVDAHTYLVYVESRACVLFFCHSIKETQQVVELTPRDVVAEALPQGSNVRLGVASWHLEPEGEGTRMHWQMSIAPDFWIPPFIGPVSMENQLLAEGKFTAEGVEKLARERAHLPPLKATHAPSGQAPKS